MVEISVNEVLQKIGRNMMLFQELEYLLKHIILTGNISGNVRDFQAIRTKQIATVSKQTMGQLVGQYIQNTHSESEFDDDESDEVSEAYVSFRFRIERDSVYYEAKKEALSSLVNERNELVHHLLPQFDPSSTQSRHDIAKKLDIQSEKVRSEVKELKEIAKSLQEAAKRLSDFLGSAEGTNFFEKSHLRSSRLVLLLGDIAEQVQRSDGWTLLNTASQLIRQHAPDEIALLKANYGHSTLKSLILASEMFEVFEEATQKGGVRVLYRLKPSLMLSN